GETPEVQLRRSRERQPKSLGVVADLRLRKLRDDARRLGSTPARSGHIHDHRFNQCSAAYTFRSINFPCCACSSSHGFNWSIGTSCRVMSSPPSPRPGPVLFKSVARKTVINSSVKPGETVPPPTYAIPPAS